MSARFAPLTGIGFAACLMVGLFLDDQPPSSGPAADMTAYYASPFHVQLIVGGLLMAVGAMLLTAFAGVVRDRTQDASPTSAALAHASGLLYASTLLTGAAVFSAIPVAQAVNAVPPPDPEVARYILPIAYTLLVWAASVPATVFVLSTSIGAWRSGAVPKWVAWAGLAAAALNLATITVAPLAVLLLWVVVFCLAAVAPGSRARATTASLSAA